MKAGWKRWALIGLGVLVIGGIGYVLIADVPIAEITSDGGEKPLRETYRPARGAPRVVVFAFDGVGAQELRRVLDGGLAPRLGALLGATAPGDGLFERGYIVEDALSILPSTTYAAWASIYTGEPSGRTGVPGNEWFARDSARYYAPAPVSVTGTEQVVQVYSDDLIGGVLRVPTVYELADVRSYVSLASVYRGADILTTPSPSAIVEIAAAAAEGLTDDESVPQDVYESLDGTAAESLVGTLAENGIPDLQVVYFPGVDLYTHVATPPIEEQIRYLSEVADPAIGLIIDEYRRQNALDDTYFVIVSDHGHTPVLDDDRHSLGAHGEDEPTAILELAGFRLRPTELEIDDDERDFQATVAYQGAIAYVYLADRSTCPEDGDVCSWALPPRHQEDLLPVAEAFFRASAEGAGVPEMQGTLDLVFARPEYAAGADIPPFQVYDGNGLIPIGAYLAANPRPDLLELESRLADLATGPEGDRAGDILLLTRSGIERPIDDRYYFSGRYHSWHGSPSAQDSHFSLAIGHTSLSGAALRERLASVLGEGPSQLDVTPLILELLRIGGGQTGR